MVHQPALLWLASVANAKAFDLLAQWLDQFLRYTVPRKLLVHLKKIQESVCVDCYF